MCCRQDHESLTAIPIPQILKIEFVFSIGEDMMDRNKLKETDFRKVESTAPAPTTSMASPAPVTSAVPVTPAPVTPAAPMRSSGGYGNGTNGTFQTSSAGTNGSNGSQVAPTPSPSRGPSSTVDTGNTGGLVMFVAEAESSISQTEWIARIALNSPGMGNSEEAFMSALQVW